MPKPDHKRLMADGIAASIRGDVCHLLDLHFTIIK